eukprot:Nk52_evm8s262 gene=Nk52_evmTU8s262
MAEQQHDSSNVCNKSQPLLKDVTPRGYGNTPENRSTESLIPRSTSESSLELPQPVLSKSDQRSGGISVMKPLQAASRNFLRGNPRRRVVLSIVSLFVMLFVIAGGICVLYYFGVVQGREEKSKLSIDSSSSPSLLGGSQGHHFKEQSTSGELISTASDDDPSSPLFINYKTCTADFQRWANHYAKEYSSFGEERTRREIFEASVRRVCQHNKGTNHTFTMGLNQFSDELPEEMARFMGGMAKPSIDYKTCTANFRLWMVFFKKFYNSAAEERRRKGVFDENVKFICETNNANNGYQAEMELNGLADLTSAEVNRHNGFRKPSAVDASVKRGKQMAQKPCVIVDWSNPSNPKCTADFDNWRRYHGVTYGREKEMKTRKRIFNENVRNMCNELRADRVKGNEFEKIYIDYDFDLAQDEYLTKPVTSG